ncbi:putative ABC transporter ATP-binding protein YbiT [Aquicella siphonis]|uniref:Putative ABC transporter ATP-binding protein YbiT n=1 Tax=Aquicella siphonis TaxID=254247 RepID=A0A5E4PH56_9COXI|nr:ABC-F family ATP-binding cassette domain-containing protein [Aquicella siphonis]VVC75703.1 putative ABC transporter ATP-binding protein YbiT [Aquicella siphonis]
MTHKTPQILINHLNYATASGKPLFQGLSLFLGNERTGIVGRNGIGKSSLLKLIAGELSPVSGSIQVQGTLGYCPQIFQPAETVTVSELLNVRQKIEALTRIENGSTNDADFLAVGDDWTLHGRVMQQLSAFGLAHLALDQPVHCLSGGEKTRLLLCRALNTDADYLILDEPTNNLDMDARRHLYQRISQWEKGMLIVSHDRVLLNLMQHIIELNTLGMTQYGGNFDHYQEQKALLQSAREHEAADARKTLAKTSAALQLARERAEQKRARGRRLFTTGKIDRLFANSKKGRSERTQGRMARQKESLTHIAEQRLEQARANIEITREIQLNLQESCIPNGKILLEIKELSFSYDKEQPVIHQFNLHLAGPERIALIGRNGSGKTTLVKLILGELEAEAGKIYLGTDHISYLDQNAASLDPELSILDNFLAVNPDATTLDAYAALATFLFRNTAAQRLVKHLSGGEKLRAELACTLLSRQPPRLLILDEPTNHLDLESLASVESALKDFQGAIIAISHDEKFLHNINITRLIYAPFTHT